MKKSHPLAALGYARSVGNGKTPACVYVRQACKRFIDDLKRKDIVFDETAAQAACNFIETLPHTKGKWASKKETLRLEPWQKFIICNVFGFKRKDGTRRFRDVYCEIPRKNGKSAIAAGVGLYMFCADGEFGAEVYSGATTEKQAWEVFRPMKHMVDRTPALRNHYDIESNAKTLVIMSSGSRAEPLIGKPGDGASPSCAIVDEYHEHDSDDLYQTMETGMGSREQPLMFVITTAGSNLGGPCYEKRRDMIRILEGQVQDDSVFAVIYGLDEDDEWDTPEALVKANPNYGVSVNSEFLLSQLETAKRSASKQNHFKTKHLNQWVGARAVWMNMLAWQRQKLADPSRFKRSPCHIAVDLASRKDVAVVLTEWKFEDEFYTEQRFYIPESALEENEVYQRHADFMTVTPGNMTDQAFIEEEIKSICQGNEVVSIAFDDWQADYMMTRLMDCGLPVVNFNQTVKNMSTPMKEVEASVLDRKLWHDGNPVMTWMMGNVAAKLDAKDNIYPRKENERDPRCKIDGPVALIMAHGRWLSGAETDEDITPFTASPLVL
jgi:phage terminase large subunit-like protein